MGITSTYELGLRSIMEETHTSLTPNKERKNVFPNVPVTGFWNCTSLKACSTLWNLKMWTVWQKKTLLVCDYINTATNIKTKAYQEHFTTEVGTSIVITLKT